MKQRMLIFGALIILVLLLVGLNAATYVQKEKMPDTEFAPNRSSYNNGSTGSRAFYTLLSETGRNVRRWQEPLDTIASNFNDRPSVFVMIGPLRRELTDVENVQLMDWVSGGGTLVLIDRDAPSRIAAALAPWRIEVKGVENPALFGIDNTDQRQMTDQTPALKPSLPSSFTNGVNSVQPSRFASNISVERSRDAPPTARGLGVASSPPPPAASTPSATPFDFYGGNDPPVTGEPDEGTEPETVEDETPDNDDYLNRTATLEAPLVHVGDGTKQILVEAPHGAGRIVILSDPYVVSNAGINLVDNSRLAINIVTSRDGMIAFDEYHHGYGANNNRLFQYFEGTPVMSIFLQFAIIIALVFVSQSRRFGRPVPEPEPDRLSKLEYVSAMAELQQRTRAYDLAIENIYSDLRRRACALLGLDSTTATRRAIAERAAERIGANARDIEDLLFQCEDIIHGEPIGKRETIELVERLRRLEQDLGLKRSVRKGV